MQISLVAKPSSNSASADSLYAPSNKFVRALKEIGFDDKGISMFIMSLQPLIQEMLANKVSEVFTEIELQAFMDEAKNHEMDQYGLAALIEEGYVIKTDRNFGNEVGEYFDKLADELIQVPAVVQHFMQQIKNLPEDQLEQKMDELVTEYLVQKADGV